MYIYCIPHDPNLLNHVQPSIGQTSGVKIRCKSYHRPGAEVPYRSRPGFCPADSGWKCSPHADSGGRRMRHRLLPECPSHSPNQRISPKCRGAQVNIYLIWYVWENTLRYSKHSESERGRARPIQPTVATYRLFIDPHANSSWTPTNCHFQGKKTVQEPFLGVPW